MVGPSIKENFLGRKEKKKKEEEKCWLRVYGNGQLNSE